MRRITYYFSLLSPFTYLAGDRLEWIAERRGVEIDYRPTDIMKVFAAMGTPPVPQRHVSRQEYRAQDLQRLAARAGLAFNLRPAHWPTDAAPASAAVIAVTQKGGNAGALARLFLSEVWARDRDIAAPEVITDALARVGEDAAGLAPAIEAAAEVYAGNTEAAIADGAFGAPFYIVDGQRFWGADRLDDLDWWLGR